MGILKIGVAGIIAGLFVTNSLAGWKMMEFRDRLHAITENQRWEETLEKAGAYKDRRVVLFGDSQVELWPVSTSFGAMPIYNRGISGDWAAKAVSRFHRDVIELKPNTVVILIGTNDLGNGQSVASITQAVSEMIAKAKTHHIEVVLCSILPVRGEYVASHQTTDVVAVNAALHDLAERNHAEFVDFYSLLADKDGLIRSRYTSDGLHASNEAYLLMARALYGLIAEPDTTLATRSPSI